VSLLACSWLSPPRPGFRRRFTPGAPANGSWGARPTTFRSGPSAARRLLQPPQPASTPARPPDPRPGQLERALARAARRAPLPRGSQTAPARATEASRDNDGPCTDHGWRPSPVLLRPFRMRLRAPWMAFVEPDGRQSSLHGPGAPLSSREASLRRSPLRAIRREFFPNPICSDTSRHGTAAPPAGDSGAAPCEGCLLRGSLGDPTKGRITRPSAKRAGIRRTRGAFHR